ncbi:Fe2+-dependent dioxygenase [Paraburkholderia hospita]|uniref:Fe2+-dependent dioxygenase n=1 Tax=Paraburkholderia hospita TaxID=169430 RepID=UPI0009A72088|nr:Fe2+-dependent dioxygenase [Paraburkholderia hospita]SKC74412.1 Predicted 2-oxoglutarate-and Fe(II)-dependent dioxygenase YbiX [Paraburkholderia hospita]
MLIEIPDVLTADELGEVRRLVQAADLVDGRVTAGELAAQAKRNLQLSQDAPAAREAGEIILKALGRNTLFHSAALPLRVLPPLFNRYDVGMKFDAHVDGAVRAVPGAGIRMRADVSSTLFLTDPQDYDGGELVIEHNYGTSAVKLAAGSMVVYPAGSLHRVNEITRGSRWGAFFWTQSMLKDDGLRTLLYDLDMAIIEVRQQLGQDTHGTLALTSIYHNLLRRGAEL